MFQTNWTNACEIFRDLSVAQGDVPVSVEGTLGAGDKPPALNIKEETEEEYFLCSGGGVMDEGPDLGLIQEMLDMVREENLSDDETPKETVVVITKPNTTPITAPALPTPEKQKIVTKKKETKQKRRNIALESFIGIDVAPKNELKLLKPDDLITKVAEPDLSIVKSSINKVNDWLLSNEETKVIKKPAICLQPATNMFRKKTKGKSPIKSPKENISIKTDSNPKSPNQNQFKEFIPSAYAMEYCNKLKEKAKLKQNMVEDIWTKAEKQMKILDEKRTAEATIEALAVHDSETAVRDSETTTVTAFHDSETATAIAFHDSETATAIAVHDSETATAIAVYDSETATADHDSETATADHDSETAAATDAPATTEIAATLQDSKDTTTISNEQSTKNPRDPREKLELPGPRHLLTDDCIVCQAFTEFGYSGFNENMS